MTENSLQVVDHGPVDPSPTHGGLDAREVTARIQKIQRVMRAVMKEGTHYGKVPGTNKPSLWQPGAEVLLATFELAVDLDIEDLSSADETRYRVAGSVRHVPTGAIIGTGVGEASSNEEKYRWRAAVCQEEYDATPEDRRRLKWKRAQNGADCIKQVRAEVADISNTVLKMAVKRCRVDSAKSATGASDIFAQDLEDLERAGMDLESSEEPSPQRTVQQPKARSEAPAQSGSSQPTGSATPATDHSSANQAASAGTVWDEVRNLWHDKGTISEKQQKRLFGIAYDNGWSSGQIVDALQSGLGVAPEGLPWGDPYNKVVEIFKSLQPGDL